MDPLSALEVPPQLKFPWVLTLFARRNLVLLSHAALASMDIHHTQMINVTIAQQDTAPLVGRLNVILVGKESTALLVVHIVRLVLLDIFNINF